MAWSPDSKTIYFTAGNEGEAPIYALNINCDRIRGPWKLVGGFNDSPTPTPDGKLLVFDRMSIAAPNEIYSAPAATSVARIARNWYLRHGMPYRVADCICCPKRSRSRKLNDPVLSQIQMQPLESYWFNGALKDKVQGFVVKPPNFDPSKKYPVKYLIHGGPKALGAMTGRIAGILNCSPQTAMSS